MLDAPRRYSRCSKSLDTKKDMGMTATHAGKVSSSSRARCFGCWSRLVPEPAETKGCMCADLCQDRTLEPWLPHFALRAPSSCCKRAASQEFGLETNGSCSIRPQPQIMMMVTVYFRSNEKICLVSQMFFNQRNIQAWPTKPASYPAVCGPRPRWMAPIRAREAELALS